jgi:hypothetical protein
MLILSIINLIKLDIWNVGKAGDGRIQKKIIDLDIWNVEI